MLKTLATFALAATALASAVPAAADTIAVRVYPHELTSDAGRQAVVARIERSAHALCMGERTLADRLGAPACTRKLGSEMVAQIDSPQLIALWNGGKSTRVAAR